MSEAALEAVKLSAAYGGREVLNEIDLALPAGQVLCLAGHNGAGKSTLLKLLFGLHVASSGSVRLRGDVLTPRPSAMAAAGVAYVPEGRGVFPSLRVHEIFTLALWSINVAKADADARIEEVFAALPAIRTFWHRRASTLSGGQQQMVSIGRALLLRPSILLMDEPSIGLAPKLFQDLLQPIRRVQQERGISILLVEQNIRDAFTISDCVAVMKSGRIIFRGVPAELSDNAKLLELF